MTQESARQRLETTLAAARRRMFFQTLISTFVHVALILLPLSGLLVAAARYGGLGWAGYYIVGASLALTVVIPLAVALRRRYTLLHVAVEVDERADLKGRISSAWEFLRERRLDAPRMAQIRDAVQHGSRLDLGTLLPARWPRYASLLPVFAVLLVLSFYVPPRHDAGEVEAAVDAHRLRQAEELRALREDLDRDVAQHEELKDVLEKLEEVEKRFNEGELQERDLLIQLARLDEDLRQKMAQLGVENLEGEVEELTPHMMAATASRAAGMALKAEQMEKAAAEMEKLGEKAGKGELSEKEREELSRNLGAAAAKMGSKSGTSLSGDLAKASESLKSGDDKSFDEAARKMAGKFSSLGKFRQMQKMRQRMSLCKSELGQKECAACDGAGCAACQGNRGGEGNEGGKKGGLKAGTQTAGDPLGERNRLADSYREMLQVAGMAGEGPVESQVEETDGQLTPSQIEAKDLYEEYAAVAEEAIEREEIPLSHRFHVKRYFQAIRPSE